MKLSELSGRKVIENLQRLIRFERKTTAEILEYINEVDSRKLYLEMGYPNLFLFLTQFLRYPPASAQRRIDSVRLMQSVPQITAEIVSGNFNLSQASLMAQGLREQKRSSGKTASRDEKLALFEKIKNQDVAVTQVLVAKELNLPVKQHETKRLQQDESVRIEITLTKEQLALCNRVRELTSHVKPGATWAELFELMAKDSIKARDVAAKKPRASAKDSQQRNRITVPLPNESLAAAEPCRATTSDSVAPKRQTARKAVPTAVKRIVFQRDQCCQWRDPHSGQICGSRFLLQLDHKNPVRNDGLNTPENLQLLCGSHNRFKYRQEIGLN